MSVGERQEHCRQCIASSGMGDARCTMVVLDEIGQPGAELCGCPACSLVLVHLIKRQQLDHVLRLKCAGSLRHRTTLHDLHSTVGLIVSFAQS